jgi:peroxiredoxin Q/BCP
MAKVRGPQVGDVAPDFELTSQSGERVRLSDYRGRQTVVLYFYPKDDTPGCTAQACSLRDGYEDFTEAGAQVIGISSDSAESHTTFAQKYRLPFVLLADEGGAVRKAYDVPAVLGILPGRVTYVIDREGVVRHVFAAQGNIGKHVNGALAVVRELAAAR